MWNMNSTHRKSDDRLNFPKLERVVNERIGQDWCLFLDRDGVINKQIVGDYVRDIQQFELIPGAIQAIKTLRDWAPYMVVVTNQQGIGKGLMSSADVHAIHQRLHELLEMEGVTLDAVFVCPHLASEGCPCRKPQPGLVLEWLDAHPHVDKSLGIMAGDSLSDLELAANVAALTGGCLGIQIGDKSLERPADISVSSLRELANAIEHIRLGQK